MDMLILGLRVVLSLAAVLALIWLLHRRFGGGNAHSDANPILVLGRRNVSHKASVVVLETEGRRFVLGVTDTNVTVMHMVDAVASPGVDSTTGMEGDSSATSFRRHLREAETKRPELLAGSIMSKETWKQASAALRNGIPR